MFSTIIVTLIVGAIIGALARLVMPGSQNIGVLWTVVLGVLGAVIGSWLTSKFGYSNSNGGFEFIPFIVGVIVAVVLIAGFVAFQRSRGSTRA